MDTPKLYGPLKAVACLVLASMLGAVAYAAYISVTHWTGIGV
jgi:hypothetical protein